MDNLFILVLIAASILGTALMFAALRKSRIKDAEYDAFAAKQGWRFTPDKGTRGEIIKRSFSDPDDDWTLDVVFIGDGPYDGFTTRYVQWHSPQGALPEGQAVLGIPIPPKAVAMLQGGGALGQQLLKTALKATLHALGKTPFDLTIDEATAGHPGGVVMASDGQARAMDPLRDNADLARFRATHKEPEVPVIIRDTHGLTLRRPGSVKSLDDLAALVALGKSLRADL